MACRFLTWIVFVFFVPFLYAKPLSWTPGDWGTSIAVRGLSVTDLADPTDIRGLRLALAYHPADGIHKRLHVFFEGAYAAYRSNRSFIYDHIEILSLASVARFYLLETTVLSPYIEGSIGPAYMSAIQLGQQHLGLRYTFQDKAAVGVSFGPKKQASLALMAVHYSNADISRRNDGLTIPLMLTFDFIFD